MALKTASQEMAQWLEKCKPMIRNKMGLNIDVRADKLDEVINNCIQSIVVSQNKQEIPFFKISPELVASAKKELWNKVDHWLGLGCFRKQQRDFKTYKKNADNWWNRHKAEWIGQYFFFPLFNDVLPAYIRTLSTLDPQNNNGPVPDTIYNATYDLLFFRVLCAICHAEISFARTKFLPLILDQSLCPKKCKNTLQPLFIALGNRIAVPWANTHIQKGESARIYTQQWVKEAVTKAQSVYDETLTMHYYSKQQQSYDSYPAQHVHHHHNNHNHSHHDIKDVNDLYLDASGVIPAADNLFIGSNSDIIFSDLYEKQLFNGPVYKSRQITNGDEISVNPVATPTPTAIDIEVSCSLNTPNNVNNDSLSMNGLDLLSVYTPTDISSMHSMQTMDECLMFGMDPDPFYDCNSVKI